MTSEDLCDVARWLADDNKTGRSKQAFRRRSVSTSYYAVFHALAHLCTDEMLGSTPAFIDRTVVYRALDHGPARLALSALAKQVGDGDLKEIASVFEGLLSARHDADYSEDWRLTAAETLEWCDAATKAIDQLRTLKPELRRALAIRLMLKSRPERR